MQVACSPPGNLSIYLQTLRSMGSTQFVKLAVRGVPGKGNLAGVSIRSTSKVHLDSGARELTVNSTMYWVAGR